MALLRMIFRKMMKNRVFVLLGIDTDLHVISKEIVVEFLEMGIFAEYNVKKQQVTNMMWSLNVPVIVLLCLYMFMISGLIIDREK